jgi:hypothetical protein
MCIYFGCKIGWQIWRNLDKFNNPVLGDMDKIDIFALIRWLLLYPQCLSFSFYTTYVSKGVTCPWGRGMEELYRRPDCLWCLSSLLLFIQIYCPYATLGYERPTSHLFNRYQHPFGHTSRASEIILTDPILALCAIGCSQSREETVPQSHGPGCWCVSPLTVSVVIP